MFCLRIADPLSKAKADAVTREKVDEYIKLLLPILKEKDLIDKPHCFIMLTKVGCHWSTTTQKSCRERYKKVYRRSSGNKAQITIEACASVTSVALPPMVIFQGVNLNHDLTKDEVSPYGLSDKTGLTRPSSFTGLMIRSSRTSSY